MPNGSHTYREIYQQPQSFAAVNRGMDGILAELDTVFAGPHAYDSLIFTGCGTSLYLAQSAAHMVSATSGVSARAVPCSELYFFPDVYVGGRNALVLPITRKSVTTEVRMAIDRVRAFPGVKTLAITCDARSSQYNDYMILSPDAAEESVVMTRSFTSMLYLAAVLALRLGGREELLNRMLERLPVFAEEALPLVDAFAKRMVDEHPELDLYVVMGQGEYYGIANENMNKVKEMGLAHSEAYYSLEYRHGPMSIADDRTLALTLAHGASAEYEAKLLEQLKGFGAVTAAVGDNVSAFTSDYKLSLGLGLGETCLAPVAAFIGQLLGYHIAMRKGLDADAPRHLSQAIVL